MYVIGTAGHVDHGKSALVLALSGIDPDRLSEEKERGLTIDLGFAWTTLPSGREVSIIDVPGHERFIKNMLAGVGGIDLALLVIAADEGVMPQTREHLDILDLLQVQHGVVAVTKSDLVEQDWLELVKEEARELVGATALKDARVVDCSATTGDGLDGLKAALDDALSDLPPVRDVGRPRLAIDRAFTISGFGTVVTGTLVDGSLRTGDEVVIEPAGISARIRGLQTHKENVEVADPGTRTAVNLSGVSKDELTRGLVLTTPGWLQASTALDVRLRVVADRKRALRHNSTLTLHTGAAEEEARVRLLEGDTIEPGDEQWAQLRLRGPVAAARGDFFVLRGSNDTVAGGRIVDTRPRRHRRNETSTLQALERLLEGSPDDALLTVLQRLEPVGFAELRSRSELEAEEARQVAERQIDQGAIVALDRDGLKDASVLVSAAGLRALQDRALRAVREFTEEQPLRPGLPREDLRSRLGLESRAFAVFEETLLESAALMEHGGALDLPGRQAALSPEQEAARDALLQRLAEQGTRPEADTSVDAQLAGYLESEGKIVALKGGIYLLSATHASMLEATLDLLKEQEQVTLAEVRDRLATSRKVAQAFLEDLDQRRVTRRVGDARVLRG